MAITALTTTPVKFLRRMSMPGVCPTYLFPVGESSSVVYRFGDALVMDPTTGKVVKGSGAAATGIPLSAATGVGLVGFAVGASASAPPFPTAAGVASGSVVLTGPATHTPADPIPATEYILVAIPLPDCIFQGHMTNGATDITVPTRTTGAAGGLLERFGLWVGTPTGETSRVMVDVSTATTNTIATTLDWAYPQPIPAARGTSGVADPWRVILGTAGTVNPAVEFVCVGTMWNPTA